MQGVQGVLGRAQGSGVIELWLQQACCLPVSFMTMTSEFLGTRKRFCCEKESSLFFFFSLGKIIKDTYSIWH